MCLTTCYLCHNLVLQTNQLLRLLDGVVLERGTDRGAQRLDKRVERGDHDGGAVGRGRELAQHDVTEHLEWSGTRRDVGVAQVEPMVGALILSVAS